MSNITAPPIPTTNSPDIPAPAIAVANDDFAQFLETLMTKQRGHRQADTAEVSLAKLQLWDTRTIPTAGPQDDHPRSEEADSYDQAKHFTHLTETPMVAESAGPARGDAMKPPTNNGWVKMRRGILDHVSSGQLNLREYGVLTFLIMLADSSTGSGIVNSPLLQYWFPELSSDGAQRVLVNLEREGFIYRDNPQGHKRAYQYWINKFEATTGPNRLRLSNLLKVFETKDISTITWEEIATDPATHPATEGATHPATDPANSNKKSRTQDRKNGEQRKQPPVSSPLCDSLCDSKSDYAKEDASVGNPQCLTGGVTQSVIHSVTPISDSLCDSHSDPINGAAGLAEMFAPKTKPKPKPKEDELPMEPTQAEIEAGIAKEIARRNKGATA